MLNILNLTPHRVSVLKMGATVSDRYGHHYLREENSIQDAVRFTIEPDAIPLSAVEGPFEPSEVGVSCSGPLGDLAFNRHLDDRMLDGADIVIISAKMAGVLNAKIPGLLMQQIRVKNPLNLDLISMDRFYIPDNLVKQEGRVVGCLSFRRILFPLSLLDFCNALEQGRKVSVISLFRACEEYCALPLAQRQSMAACVGGRSEYALALANQYIVSKGFRPYPTLNELVGYRQVV